MAPAAGTHLKHNIPGGEYEGKEARTDYAGPATPAAGSERRIGANSQTPASKEVLGRGRLYAGLYVFLLDERSAAVKEWRAAHRLGARDPRSVTAAVWTPGAIEAFRSAQ